MERTIEDFVKEIYHGNQKVYIGKVMKIYESEEEVLAYSEYYVLVDLDLHLPTLRSHKPGYFNKKP